MQKKLREKKSVEPINHNTPAAVGIHAVDLVWGLGTIHCLTREQPAK